MIVDGGFQVVRFETDPGTRGRGECLRTGTMLAGSVLPGWGGVLARRHGGMKPNQGKSSLGNGAFV